MSASRRHLEGLPLVRPTSPAWARVAAANLDALLADHAHCELKAASMALSLAGRHCDRADLVRRMTSLAHEELRHFERVRRLLAERGRGLPRMQADPYVVRLRQALRSGSDPLTGQLLACLFVEARSCERFRILAEERRVPPALRALYRELASAEARHHEVFLRLAVAETGEERARRLVEAAAEREAEIARELPVEPRMH